MSETIGDQAASWKDPRIYKRLTESPATSAELAPLAKCSVETVLLTLNQFIRDGNIESLGNSYYGIAGHKYKSDIETKDIRRVPPYFFGEIPVIKRWAIFANSPARKQQIADFRWVCYGQVVDGFTCLPAAWIWPDTFVEFIESYREKMMVTTRERISSSLLEHLPG
jgi:hypothetical protein